MRRRVIYASGGLVVVLVVLALVFSGSPPAPRDAAIEVTAADLDAAYLANEVRADHKYKAKPVRVIGLVDSIEKDALDHPVVILRTNRDTGVTCTFAKADDKVLDLDRDQKVALRCTGAGFAAGAMLESCTVDEVHGPACEVWNADNSGQAVHGECKRIAKCSGATYRGYCSGPADVVCCVTNAPPPVDAPPARPGRLERAAQGH